MYKTVQIGTQKWMAENLNTAMYKTGDYISTGLNDTEWNSTSDGSGSVYRDARPLKEGNSVHCLKD